MKLLILAGEFPPFRGGIATYARELAEAAVGLGYDVTVAAPDYWRDQTTDDVHYPFRVLRFAGGENTMLGILKKLRWIRKLAALEAFEIVHAADWPFFLPVALSPYRKRSRCLVTFHGTEINQLSRRSRRIVLKLANFWDGWALAIANSRFTAEHLLRTFPEQRAGQLRAIPLGVRPPASLGIVDRPQARAALGLADEDFVVLSLGRIVQRKGHHIAVEALAMLPKTMRSQLVWYVVGPEVDPSYTAAVRAAAASGGVQAVFAGALPGEALENVFAAADLFCVPSVWGANGEFEGFGLAYIEAGLRGLPSIATTVGGIPDAVIDNQTGLLVAPSDADALAAALVRLWHDESLRMRLGAAALHHAQTATWSRVAELTYSS